MCFLSLSPLSYYVVYGVPFLIAVVFLILDSGVPYACVLLVLFSCHYCSLDLPFPYPYPCLAWRRAKTSCRLGCALLDFCIFASFHRWFCLGWRLGVGQNLVHTPLDFAWFVRFLVILILVLHGEGRKPRSDLAWLCLIFRIFCYSGAWGDGHGGDKTSFTLALTLLDFCYFIACVGLDCMRGEGRKPRSDWAWFCLFLLFYCHWDWGDRRGEDKTSFRISLILRDSCHSLLLS